MICCVYDVFCSNLNDTFITDMVKLKQNVKARKLDGFSLEICEMPPARGIVVTSDNHIRSREALVFYFERESIGGGPLRKNGEAETEDGCCLLEFEDHKGMLFCLSKCHFL